MHYRGVAALTMVRLVSGGFSKQKNENAALRCYFLVSESVNQASSCFGLRVCSGTGRARSFELLYGNVLPQEVLEIDGVLSGWTAKIHLIWVRQPILDGPTEVWLD